MLPEIFRDNLTQLANIFEQIKDEIDKLTDPKDENISGNDLSIDSYDNLDDRTPDVTDTAETDHYSITLVKEKFSITEKFYFYIINQKTKNNMLVSIPT